MKNRDFIKETQPIFYRMISQSFKRNNKAHAFLLTGDYIDEAILFLTQSLLCKNSHLACEECENCTRVKEGNYPDIIQYDGLESSIKKENIDYIQREFQKTAIEDNGKIYILKNIEKSSVVAMNSMLKFLEEPNNDIYAILTTQNLNKILPTIQSRCQVIHLKPISQKALEKRLLDKDMGEDAKILSQIFHSEDVCLSYKDNEDYIYCKNEVFHYIEDLYHNKENLFINQELHMIKKYGKNRDVVRLFLNMLVLGLRDVFHVKQNLPLTYSYPEEILKDLPKDDRILNKLDIVLETISLLDTNTNLSLLLENMTIKILKEV